jgi:hypothetical protein
MHIVLATVFHSVRKLMGYYPKDSSLLSFFSTILYLWSTNSKFLHLLSYFTSSVCQRSFYTTWPTHYLTPTLGEMSGLYASPTVIMKIPLEHHVFLYDKGEVNKVHPITCHEGIEGEYEGQEVYLYSFFNCSTRCRWVINAMPQPLHPQCAMYRGLRGPQGKSGHMGKT